MGAVLKVLIKFLVVPFYKVNFGFFLFWFFLFFGIISSTAVVPIHKAAIEAQIFVLSANIGVIVFWGLYGFKCYLFSQRYILNYKEGFTHIFQALNSKYQYLTLGCCFFLMFLPVLIYASVVFSAALYFKSYIPAANILLFLIGSLVYFTNRLRKSIKLYAEVSPKTSSKVFSKFIDGYTITINLLLFIPLYLWKKRKITLLLLKGISMGTIYLFLSNMYEELNISYFTMFLLLLSFFNALLVFFVQEFSEKELFFLRNLPLTFIKRYLLFISAGAILFIPELTYLVIYGIDDISLWQVLGFYLLFVSQFVLCVALSYTPYPKGDAKKFLKLLFIVFLLVSIIFLFSDIWVLIIASICVSMFLLRVYYHKYEYMN